MQKLPLDQVHIDEVLFNMVEGGYSELYVEVGNAPHGRSRGANKLEELKQYEVVRQEIAQRLVYDIISNEQIDELEGKRALVFIYFPADVGEHVPSFSVHIAHTEGNINSIFHLMPNRSSYF